MEINLNVNTTMPKGLLITFVIVIVILIGNPFNIRNIVVDKIQGNELSRDVVVETR